MRTLGSVLALAVMAAALGCGRGQSQPPAPISSSAPSVTVPAGAASDVQRAQMDAERQTGTAAASWQVIEVTPRQWPDSGLGCPKPGVFYTQIVTSGYLIMLRAGERTVEYHSGSGQVVYCRE